MNKVIKIMGITYKTVPEIDECKGCSFRGTPSICDEYAGDCGGEEFIWVESTGAKYSMVEIKKVIGKFTTFSSSTWEDIENRLEECTSAEYAEYLRLKDKYEGENK